MVGFSQRVEREFLKSCELISSGSLRVKTPSGDIHDFGEGKPQADMEIRDWAAITWASSRGDIGLGEAYVAGLWETSSIENLTQLGFLNSNLMKAYAHAGFWQGLKFRLINRVLRANSQVRAPRNIRAHYDVGNEFYQLWLDRSMTYSSALFENGETDLARAQDRKYGRVLDRLTGEEDILEIGCGWGGFAERAANAGRFVTGLTLSPSQKGYADARLDGRAEICLKDYREVTGQYANIVSIEMIEAVGEAYWPIYFRTVKQRLKEGGRALIQAITVQDSYFETYRTTSDYIRHYTFPGGMLLSDAVIAKQARAAGLVVRDNFDFGADYGKTCRIWGQNLETQAARIRGLGYSESFLRSWRFYLGACAGSFMTGNTSVVQVELAHA